MEPAKQGDLRKVSSL